ncbi:MAG: hypothetical protein KC731_37360 [Myxococcales bacterium]|nr:hypothetical protein [Myxococcales bacterium]
MRQRAWWRGRIARDEEELRSPLGERRCVYYELWGFGVLSGRRLEAASCGFAFEHEGAVVRVDRAGLRFEREHLTARRLWTNDAAGLSAARRLLARFGIAGERWYEARILEVAEWTVEIGDEVEIYGELRDVIDPAVGEVGYREAPRGAELVARTLRRRPG